MTQNKYYVGQEVWLIDYRNKARKVSVVRVGRTLVQVDTGYGRWQPFRMDTGIENSNYIGDPDYILTDEEKADRERRTIVVKALNDLGITNTGYGDFSQSTDALEKVLAVLKENADD